MIKSFICESAVQCHRGQNKVEERNLLEVSSHTGFKSPFVNVDVHFVFNSIFFYLSVGITYKKLYLKGFGDE